MNPLRSIARFFGYNLIKIQRQTTLEDHLQIVFSEQNPDCILDVGANRGTYGAMLRRINYRGLIVSFEPMSAPFRELSQRASRDANWRVMQMALGDKEETRTMACHPRSDVSSLLQLNALGVEMFGENSTPSENVQIRRGDNLWTEVVPENAHSVFLKTDTQGFDMNVLRGFGECLGKICCIQIEAAFTPIYLGMPRYHDVLSYLESSGFALSGIYAVSRGENQTIIEADFVFIRAAN